MGKNFLYHTNELCANGEIEYAYSFHDLRHYYASLYYKNSNHNISVLKKLLGHTNLNTTDKYVQDHGLNRPMKYWN